MFLHPSAEEYGIDYVEKIDDDTVVDTDLLMEFVNDELPLAPFNIPYLWGKRTAKCNKKSTICSR